MLPIGRRPMQSASSKTWATVRTGRSSACSSPAPRPQLGLARRACGLFGPTMPLIARLPATALAPGHRLRGVLVTRGSVETVHVPEVPPGKAIARRPAKAAQLTARPTTVGQAIGLALST